MQVHLFVKLGGVHLRPFLKGLFLVPALLGVLQGIARGDDILRAEYLPKTVMQGDGCLVRAWGPPFKSIHGEVQGQRFPMTPCREEGVYQGLIGIGMNTRPGPYETKIVAINGDGQVSSRLLSLKVGKANFGTEKLSLPPDMVDLDGKALERVHSEAARLKALFQIYRDERLWKGAFICPVEGKLSSTFGLGRVINGQRKSPHTGVDLEAKEGTPVVASNHGVAVLVDTLFFSGNSVILDHGWGFFSMYFHLSQALVKDGERIPTGTMIGRVGSTGRSTGPHLHWGIRVRENHVDPLSVLRLGEYLRE